MSRNFVWTFNITSFAQGVDGIFSFEYHVPGAMLKIPPEDLIDARLWLVARIGTESFLYGVILPAMLERYTEGTYKNDYLMHTNAFGCVRFLPRSESRKPWIVSSSFEEALRECSEEESGRYLEMLRSNYRVGFAGPSKTILDAVPMTKLTDIGRAVPDQLALALRSVSFGDISRSRDCPKSLSAIGGIALRVLLNAQPHIDPTEAEKLIASLEPIGTSAESPLHDIQGITKSFAELPPMVDTFLEEIDPESIAPRSFVASAQSYSSDWLDKTNDAEEAHERMLKDMVLYLKTKGYRLYRSRSFDLFAEKADTRLLFEIKSAVNENAAAQGEKGIVQLLRYASAISSASIIDGVVYNLLLQDSEQSGVHQHLSKMSQRTGFNLWLYDERKEWPQRVYDLQSKTPEWIT